MTQPDLEPIRADARLVLLGRDEARALPLVEGPYTLGKRPENDLVLPCAGVSRAHAVVRREGRAWVLEDLGSRNGIRFAGRRVERRRLRHGDEVLLGMARLRFERCWREAARASLRAAVGRIAARPRAALGLSSGLALLLVLSLAAVGDSEPPNSLVAPARAKALGAQSAARRRGEELLLAGRYRRAARAFRRASVQAPPARAQALRALTAAAELLSVDSFEKPTARWEELVARLERALAANGPQGPLGAWLAERLAWAQTHRDAAPVLARALGHCARAEELLAAGRRREAAEAWDAARKTFVALPSDDPFASFATERLAELRPRVAEIYAALADEEAASPRPDYATALALIRRALDAAPPGKTQRALRLRLARLERERADEDRLARAVRLLARRDPAQVPAAVALLEAIDPRSRVAPDARAWRSWVDADRDTRRAQRLYDQGDVEAALELLDRAARGQLGPVARQSLRERRERWSLVDEEFERGTALARRGQKAAARRALQTVLALEPNPQNRLHRLARRELAELELGQRPLQRRWVEEGLAALGRGDCGAALRAFEALRRDPERRRADGERVAAAVRSYADAHDLLGVARRVIYGDEQARFLETRDRLELLWRWLGRRDPRRAEAGKHLRTLDRRLRSLAVAQSVK